MKKTISFLFLILAISVSAQKIPNFELRSEVTSYTHVGLRGFSKNDLYVILGSSSHMPEISPSYLVYIFNSKGDVTAYHKSTALSSERKELSEDQKKTLLGIINSKKFKKFLKYNQEDFELKNKNKKTDYTVLIDTTYSLTVIQNGKQNTYSYMAIKDHLNSNDPRINKRMLKKYATILNMFNQVKTDEVH